MINMNVELLSRMSNCNLECLIVTLNFGGDMTPHQQPVALGSLQAVVAVVRAAQEYVVLPVDCWLGAEFV